VVRHSNGKYATTLVACLPKVKANWGFITGTSLTLNRRYRYKRRVHNYLSASCPTPKGVPAAAFPFANAEFVFVGTTVESTLNRSCKGSGLMPWGVAAALSACGGGSGGSEAGQSSASTATHQGHPRGSTEKPPTKNSATRR
jgi:hypothetical protein